VSNGLKHLHNLGLAYNDLNPANVMYTADDTAVLIDLDSCRAEGKSLDKWGTLDWIDAPLHISDTRNDRAALKKLETYLIAHNNILLHLAMLILPMGLRERGSGLIDVFSTSTYANHMLSTVSIRGHTTISQAGIRMQR